jgi:hypothetical protein
MGRMNDVIDTVLSTFEAISPNVMIGGIVVDGGHVITRIFYGCCSKWELINNLCSYYELSIYSFANIHVDHVFLQP